MLLFIGDAYTQNNRLRAFTLEDGLPQSQVYDLIQDEMGYLWLGTQGGGLCRFNGEEFKIWNETHGLQSNYIHALTFVNDSLFIGTKRGLSIKTKDKFTNLEGPRINKICRIKNQTYLATNVGIYSYEKNVGLRKIKLNPKINTSIINDIVFDGRLYWIATNKGLWKLNAIKKNASIIERHSAHDFTAAIFYNNKVFAAAFNQGVLVLNTNAKSYGNYWISKPLRVTNISVHNDNELWFATDNEGISIVNADKRKHLRNINRKNGLTISHIRKSILDRQSNIWIATSGGGFYKYFQNNFIHYDQNTGLKGNRVYAIHTSMNEIWASNSEAGLVKIDSSGIQHIEQDERLSEVKIKTITSDASGNIWAGTDGKGMLFKEIKKFDSIVIDSSAIKKSKNDSIVKIDTIQKTIYTNHVIDRDNGLPSDWIRTILVDNNTIWAASYSTGIIRFRYDKEKKRLLRVKKFDRKNGIKDLQISYMTQDSLGKIWYATQNGHLGYIKNGRVTHLGNVLNQKTSISTLLLHKDKMFIGTAGRGIWWSDLDKVSVRKLKGRKKPYSDNIYQMIFDDQGNLWAGSERGVDKIELNQSNDIVDIFHFGRNDGFLGIETCLNAVTKDDEGNLWFGAIYGLTKYKPTESTKATIKPRLFFEDVEVAYRSLDSINLNTWIGSDKVLKLKPNQTELSFSYKTVDLDHPNDIEYRFRLNNSEWSPWSAESKQNLAGLAYGAHYFSAQSRNYRWEESDIVTFRFFIDSPIYKKAWFQLAVLAGILMIVGGYALSYIRRVKQKNKEERERLQMQNHLLSLEQKALRLQMNPHFIFNVLNGIKAMGTSNPQRMNSTINTFATLLRETLYNSRKDYITLDQEIQTLKHYIEIEQLMASKPFTYEISIDSDLDPEEILIPPMLIQPFVENAVRHGILKGSRDGELKIEFHTTDEFLHCTVKDNGQGIFQSQKTKTNTDHQSMALTVTRERLESISGKDSLNIKEIINKGNVVAGTQIAFKIPLETDY
ncbi:two-component regulator propeller domain-containing protein [Aquimarina gracilis]|uniref:Two-component regulator propeller domain-containing protein n=1 Tax=Aquimarina gracilis TaxID=874422 RepID=A0ABU5ZUT3_9FLAO|nr:two-component regulator propeller domain-containing protein [Aquimarina gracilis]MEB3345423.1 two-component regulator propeller domain-containing protein [Aquimarina gracilis]